MSEAQEAAVEDQSMEEILQSIRRIITEDDEAEENDSSKEPIDTDVLELTEIVDDESDANAEESGGVLGDIDAALSPQDETEDISTENVDAMFSDFEAPAGMDEIETEAEVDNPPTAAEAPATEAPNEPVSAEASTLETEEEKKSASEEKAENDSLLSNTAAEATARLFNEVKASSHHSTTETASFPITMRSGATIEDLVVESMRPMLKEWLDQNLPEMVEKIVEREIRKLT